MSLFLLYEFASGYSLFNCHGLDEIGQNTEAVRNSVSDLSRFGRVVKLVGFSPFDSALDALNQINAVSEGSTRLLCCIYCFDFVICSGLLSAMVQFIFNELLKLVFSRLIELLML